MRLSPDKLQVVGRLTMSLFFVIWKYILRICAFLYNSKPKFHIPAILLYLNTSFSEVMLLVLCSPGQIKCIYYILPHPRPSCSSLHGPPPTICDLSFQVTLPPPRGCRGDRVCISSEHQLCLWYVIRSLPAIWVFHNSCHVSNKNDKKADIKANIKVAGWQKQISERNVKIATYFSNRVYFILQIFFSIL